MTFVCQTGRESPKRNITVNWSDRLGHSLTDVVRQATSLKEATISPKEATVPHRPSHRVINAPMVETGLTAIVDTATETPLRRVFSAPIVESGSSMVVDTATETASLDTDDLSQHVSGRLTFDTSLPSREDRVVESLLREQHDHEAKALEGARRTPGKRLPTTDDFNRKCLLATGAMLQSVKRPTSRRNDVPPESVAEMTSPHTGCGWRNVTDASSQLDIVQWLGRVGSHGEGSSLTRDRMTSFTDDVNETSYNESSTTADNEWSTAETTTTTTTTRIPFPIKCESPRRRHKSRRHRSSLRRHNSSPIRPKTSPSPKRHQSTQTRHRSSPMRRESSQIRSKSPLWMRNSSPIRHTLSPMRRISSPMMRKSSPRRYESSPMSHESSPMSHDSSSVMLESSSTRYHCSSDKYPSNDHRHISHGSYTSTDANFPYLDDTRLTDDDLETPTLVRNSQTDNDYRVQATGSDTTPEEHTADHLTREEYTDSSVSFIQGDTESPIPFVDRHNEYARRQPRVPTDISPEGTATSRSQNERDTDTDTDACISCMASALVPKNRTPVDSSRGGASDATDTHEKMAAGDGHTAPREVLRSRERDLSSQNERDTDTDTDACISCMTSALVPKNRTPVDPSRGAASDATDTHEKMAAGDGHTAPREVLRSRERGLSSQNGRDTDTDTDACISCMMSAFVPKHKKPVDSSRGAASDATVTHEKMRAGDGHTVPREVLRSRERGLSSAFVSYVSPVVSVASRRQTSCRPSGDTLTYSAWESPRETEGTVEEKDLPESGWVSPCEMERTKDDSDTSRVVSPVREILADVRSPRRSVSLDFNRVLGQMRPTGATTNDTCRCRSRNTRSGPSEERSRHRSSVEGDYLETMRKQARRLRSTVENELRPTDAKRTVSAEVRRTETPPEPRRLETKLAVPNVLPFVEEQRVITSDVHPMRAHLSMQNVLRHTETQRSVPSMPRLTEKRRRIPTSRMERRPDNPGPRETCVDNGAGLDRHISLSGTSNKRPSSGTESTKNYAGWLPSDTTKAAQDYDRIHEPRVIISGVTNRYASLGREPMRKSEATAKDARSNQRRHRSAVLPQRYETPRKRPDSRAVTSRDGREAGLRTDLVGRIVSVRGQCPVNLKGGKEKLSSADNVHMARTSSVVTANKDWRVVSSNRLIRHYDVEQYAHSRIAVVGPDTLSVGKTRANTCTESRTNGDSRQKHDVTEVRRKPDCTAGRKEQHPMANRQSRGDVGYTLHDTNDGNRRRHNTIVEDRRHVEQITNKGIDINQQCQGHRTRASDVAVKAAHSCIPRLISNVETQTDSCSSMRQRHRTKTISRAKSVEGLRQSVVYSGQKNIFVTGKTGHICKTESLLTDNDDLSCHSRSSGGIWRGITGAGQSRREPPCQSRERKRIQDHDDRQATYNDRKQQGGDQPKTDRDIWDSGRRAGGKDEGKHSALSSRIPHHGDDGKSAIPHQTRSSIPQSFSSSERGTADNRRIHFAEDTWPASGPDTSLDWVADFISNMAASPDFHRCGTSSPLTTPQSRPLDVDHTATANQRNSSPLLWPIDQSPLSKWDFVFKDVTLGAMRVPPACSPEDNPSKGADISGSSTYRKCDNKSTRTVNSHNALRKSWSDVTADNWSVDNDVWSRCDRPRRVVSAIPVRQNTHRIRLASLRGGIDSRPVRCRSENHRPTSARGGLRSSNPMPTCRSSGDASVRERAVYGKTSLPADWAHVRQLDPLSGSCFGDLPRGKEDMLCGSTTPTDAASAWPVAGETEHHNR